MSYTSAARGFLFVMLSVILISGLSETAEAIDLTEGWNSAEVGYYVPDDSPQAFIKGDIGKWVVGATIDGGPDCGPIPHIVEVQSDGGNKVLYVESNDSTEGCADNVWAVLFTNWGAPLNNHISIPIKSSTVLSFDEQGMLDNPEAHGWGSNCLVPPCYDNISVMIEDTSGNVLAYVLQRYPEAEPSQTREHYYEIHLDPDAGVYSRNLYQDFSLISTFKPGSNIYSIVVNVDSHGWTLIDNLHIIDSDAPIPPPTPRDTAGSIGSQTTMAGPGFGGKKGKILIGGATTKILNWTDASVTYEIQKPLPPMAYDLVLQLKEPKGADPITYPGVFTVMAPEIVSVNPTSGTAGTVITISGNYFGAKKGKVYLGTKSCKVLSWTMDTGTGESQIQCVVPKKMTSGPYSVTVTNRVGSTTLPAGFNLP